jgi:hypothetical protein
MIVPNGSGTGLKVQSSYYRFMKPTNATAPTLPILAESGPPPRIVPIAEGKSAWMSSLRAMNADRWRELGYDPEDTGGGLPVWAGLPVVTDEAIEEEPGEVVIELLPADADPNARLALQGGSLAGCDDAAFQCAIGELQKLHRECLIGRRAADAALVRAAIDNARAERRREDRGSFIDEEERAALEKCEERFAAEIARVEAEWASEKKQAQFRRPSHALSAMLKTAEKLIAAKTYDEESGIARQIAEKEAEEARLAEQKIAEGREADLAAVTAEYETGRAAILAEFQRRRKGGRRLGSPGGLGRPKAIVGQPDIVRPSSPSRPPGL